MTKRGYIKSRPQDHTHDCADYMTALRAVDDWGCADEFRLWRLGTMCGQIALGCGRCNRTVHGSRMACSHNLH